MNHPTQTTARPTARLGALALAALLAGAAGSSQAAVAKLSIDAFVVSSDTAYVTVLDSYQSFSAQALEGGGVGGGAQADRSADDWNQGFNTSAQTLRASATGSLSQFVGNLGLTTAGFTLGASTLFGGQYALPTPPNEARALANLAGAFGLIDGNGDAVAGDISFQVYYTLSVFDAINQAGTDYAQAQLDFSVSDDQDYLPFAIGLLSNDFVNGNSGEQSGFFTVTLSLLAGEQALFNLDGSTVAMSSVPEPASYGLAALALLGAGLAGRRAQRRAQR